MADVFEASDGPVFEAGYCFEEVEVRHWDSWQAKMLVVAGLPTEVWGTVAEPTLYGQDCFMAMTRAGFGIDGFVHVEHRIHQRRPVAVGESLVQRGRIEVREPAERGERIVFRFGLIDDNGATVLESELTGLLPEPEKMGPRPSGSGAVPLDPTLGLRRMSRKRLAPHLVTTYSREVGNKIHFDAGFARDLGYRAPIAQGLQTLTWMLGRALSEHRPDAFSLTARFLCPVFWDDEISVWGRAGDDVPFSFLRCVNGDGKVAVEARLQG